MIPGLLFPMLRTFRLFITLAIKKIILEETHFEGFKNYGDSWKSMDEVDLHAFIGLLILAGVYRSGGEAASRLWDAERQFLLFLAIIDLILIPFPFLFLHSKG